MSKDKETKKQEAKQNKKQVADNMVKDKDTKDIEINNNGNITEDYASNDEQDILYYLDLAQRTKADFENYKRRNENLAKSSFENGMKLAIEKLLPVIDSISQAKIGIKDKATLKGFEIINTQFLKSLESLNVKKIESEGKVFDPNLHNAVMAVSEPDKEDGIILEELQQGFIMDEKVIRHSSVKINRL